MFTDRAGISILLRNRGLIPEELTYIDRGVMTDKYSFIHMNKEYIVRCFQPYRKDQPEIEYRYLCLFQERGIMSPKPLAFSTEAAIPYLIYEKLEGEPLTDIFDSLTSYAQESLCTQIADNYIRISEIRNDGYGRIQRFDEFSDCSWHEFIMQVIENAEYIARDHDDYAFLDCCGWMKKFAGTIAEPDRCLIWSDFSSDNIIVDRQGKLAGFIDFEGLLSGDPILGLGYMAAHERNEALVSKLSEALHAAAQPDLINFYSLIRWCRLLPYQHMPLLNGTPREPIEEFLAPAYRLISSFGK